MRVRDLRCAVQTLHEEILELTFEYPLIAVPEAGPKDSLHYYLYKYRNIPPSNPAIRLDANRIALCWTRANGAIYRPGFVAMYALHNLEQYLRGKDRVHLDIFLNQVRWLEEHAVIRSDGAVVWLNDYELWEGRTLLKAPWLSSHVQGLVISALVRAWRLTRKSSFLQLLRGSAQVFRLDCECNGLRVRSDSHVVYAERPGFPAPGIMDGFMTSLLGLYDLYVETSEDEVYRLFEEGIEGLAHFLCNWDYRNKWTFYSNRAYLCSPAYHCLNRILLSVLARLTGRELFAKYAECWDPGRLSALDRVEIYFGFLVTKNVCRFRNHTWNHHSSEAPHQIVSRHLPGPRLSTTQDLHFQPETDRVGIDKC